MQIIKTIHILKDKHILLTCLCLVLCLSITSIFTKVAFIQVASAQIVNKGFFSGVSIEGYDAVSYFTESKAVAGKEDIELKWSGATWRFSSVENRELFKESPLKYAPQYGGYCAYGIAKGSKASIDPQAWAIIDGKLYLNYDTGIQEKWEQDRTRYIEEADKVWSKWNKQK